MVLTPVQSNGQWFMHGVTQDPGVSSPMGRRIFRPGNGPHFVGFDDNFTEPIIVRAFYDPSRDPITEITKPYEFAGYIQFMQLNFKGTPIPPEVYGGMLADRTPYSDASPDHHFVDFMGPKDVKLRGFYEPFYAYNGSLLDGTLRQISDFQRHPLPNGSLFYPQTTGPGLSLCASLSAEIATSLITESDIASWLTTDNLIYSIECSKQQLSQMEPYQIALNYLQQRELQGVGPADVAGQVVGQYVLISLPNYENMPPRLCISTRKQGEKDFVDIHLFGYADVESLEEETTMEALARIYDFLEKKGIRYPGTSNNAPNGRGQGGLLAAPFKLNPAEFCIELKYWTLVFAKRTRILRNVPQFELLNGFTWSALFQYDDDVRGLTLSSILEPELVYAYDWPKPLQAFTSAISNQTLANISIDTSNFTKAAMRRDDLGTGVKLRFVNRSGTVIP